MKTVLWGSLFFAIFFSSTLTAGDECQKNASSFFLYDATPQAKDAAMDYPKELELAFKKDKSALIKLFKLSASRLLDGAGAQSHADVLWSLLECWRDDHFSEILRKEPSHVQVAVIEYLDYAADKSYKAKYPKTYSLTKHNKTGWIK